MIPGFVGKVLRFKSVRQVICMYTLLDVCIVIRGFLMPRVHYYIMNGFEATDLLGEIPMRK